jgi:hypothetical protein
MTKDVGTIDIGEANRKKIKAIWEEGIKPYPELKKQGLALIDLIKRKAMGMPDATDEKIAKAQKMYDACLNAMKEE